MVERQLQNCFLAQREQPKCQYDELSGRISRLEGKGKTYEQEIRKFHTKLTAVEEGSKKSQQRLETVKEGLKESRNRLMAMKKDSRELQTKLMGLEESMEESWQNRLTYLEDQISHIFPCDIYFGKFIGHCSRRIAPSHRIFWSLAESPESC